MQAGNLRIVAKFEGAKLSLWIKFLSQNYLFKINFFLITYPGGIVDNQCTEFLSCSQPEIVFENFTPHSLLFRNGDVHFGKSFRELYLIRISL